MLYNILNWYWIVGGDTSKVFSSASLTYVSAANTNYTIWTAAGGRPSQILNADELLEVLQQQWLPINLGNGMQLESTGTPALNGTYPLDPASQSRITSVAASIAAGRGLPGGGSTFIYQGHAFTADQFLDFAEAAENYVYNLNEALAQMVLARTGSLPEQPVVIA